MVVPFSQMMLDVFGSIMQPLNRVYAAQWIAHARTHGPALDVFARVRLGEK